MTSTQPVPTRRRAKLLQAVDCKTAERNGMSIAKLNKAKRKLIVKPGKRNEVRKLFYKTK